MAAVYRDYDLNQLERQYDIEATATDLAAVMGGYRCDSERVASAGRGLLDLPYGEAPLQRLDAFPVGNGGAPVMIYVHGGYWIAGDKADRRFAAETFTAAGAVWAPINYRLAPEASLDDMAADVRACVAWVYRNAAEIGADPERIHVSGTSAGGHLTGMLLAPGWHDAFGVPETVIKSASLFSGLYDLDPFLHTSHSDYLRLDASAARRNSPLFNLPDPATCPPLLVSWGGKETDEFRRQSQAYAEACAATGIGVETLPMAEHDHFTLIGELARSNGPLVRALLARMELGPAGTGGA